MSSSIPSSVTPPITSISNPFNLRLLIERERLLRESNYNDKQTEAIKRSCVVDSNSIFASSVEGNSIGGRKFTTRQMEAFKVLEKMDTLYKRLGITRSSAQIEFHELITKCCLSALITKELMGIAPFIAELRGWTIPESGKWRDKLIALWPRRRGKTTSIATWVAIFACTCLDTNSEVFIISTGKRASTTLSAQVLKYIRIMNVSDCVVNTSGEKMTITRGTKEVTIHSYPSNSTITLFVHSS